MFGFTYHTPTKIVFGKDAELKVGELAAEAGAKKVLVHYGSNRVADTGLLGSVLSALDAQGIEHVELGGVVPNPRIDLVRAGIDLAQKKGVDFVLGVGGGSVIDSCKAIAYGLGEPEYDVWDIYEHTRTPKACYPIGAVLTIAAAGSEMSNSSVITEEEQGKKRGCNSDLCRCRFACMNPALTLSLPAYQTACGCTDIMMHTMERYFTQGGNMQLTDQIAEGLIRTVRDAALVLRDDPENYDARAEVMWASSLSHNGLTGCGIQEMDFASHALEHELSAMFDVAHGAGLAAIWGSWARYVMDECIDRFVKFAVEVWDVEPEGTERDVALAGIETCEEFFRSIGMPTSLAELGLEVSDDQIKQLASGCAAAKGGHAGAAKVLYENDMAEIYHMAR